MKKIQAVAAAVLLVFAIALCLYLAIGIGMQTGEFPIQPDLLYFFLFAAFLCVCVFAAYKAIDAVKRRIYGRH